MRVANGSKRVCEEGKVHIQVPEMGLADMETLCGFGCTSGVKLTNKRVTCKACIEIAKGVIRDCKPTEKESE